MSRIVPSTSVWATSQPPATLWLWSSRDWASLAAVYKVVEFSCLNIISFPSHRLLLEASAILQDLQIIHWQISFLLLYDIPCRSLPTLCPDLLISSPFSWALYESTACHRALSLSCLPPRCNNACFHRSRSSPCSYPGPSADRRLAA